MASYSHKTPLYPEVVIQSNPNPYSSSSSNLYPSFDMRDLAGNLFPEPTVDHQTSPTAPLKAIEEVLIKIPGAILNLIDKHYSVELACGDLTIVRLRQGDDVVTVLARVADEIQWPLMKDEAAVKLDHSHYFFTLPAPKQHASDSDDDDDDKDSDNMLNYGLTIASKGQEKLLKNLDSILQNYSSFSEQKVSDNAKKKGEALDGSMAMEVSPADLKSVKKKELMEKRCAAYWTTLAPNVEDYSSTTAKMIAAGSGKLIQGILWCGDVTIESLRLGNDVMKKRLGPGSNSEISPQTLKRIKRYEIKRIYLCFM